MSRSLPQLRQRMNRVIDLRLRRRCVVIEPIPHGLRIALTIRETTFKGSRPVAGEFHLEPFKVDMNGSLQIAPGLLSRAVQWLKEHSYECRIHDERIAGAEEANRAAVTEAGNDRELPPILENHTHGTFVIAGLKDCTRAIADVCKCLPTAKIGIVTAGTHDARWFSHVLGSQLSESPCCRPGTNYWYQARIRVLGACHRNAFHGEHLDVILIVFGYNAVSQASMQNLLSLRPAPERVYVLRKQGRMNPAETIALEALAGPVIYTSPRVRRIERQICSSRSFPDLRLARDLESRQKIWRHEGRNRWIAEVAQACVEHDMEKLWDHGLFLDEGEHLPESPGVAVLVESRTHAAELNRYLEGWPVLDLAGGMAAAGPGGRIITLARMAEGPVAAADVMILAAGDSRSLPLAPHRPGQVLHVIVLADGLYETRRSRNPANPGGNTVSFPVISSPLSYPATQRETGRNRENKGKQEERNTSLKGGTRKHKKKAPG